MDDEVEVSEIPGGRIVKPIGSIFRLSSKTISQMSDGELSTHISTLKKDLQSKKQEVDSLTIQLSQSTNEVAERDERKRMHLRNVRIPTTGRVKQQAAATPKDALKNLVHNWKAEGFDDLQIAGRLAQLLIQMQRGQPS